jgi:hypothetical protein
MALYCTTVVGWMLNWEASSEIVAFPFVASRATLALNFAEHRFRLLV